MKNNIQKAVCIAMVMTLMGGCSMNTNKKTNEKVNEVKESAKDHSKTARNDANDNIDNVMDYFKKEGLKFENTKALKNIDFAAYEGRSFTANGSTAYLYRVKSDDENMKKVLKEAKEKGKVKVNIDHKEQEYGAKVNGNYLFLYDTNANFNDYVTAFPNYTMGGVNGNNQTMNPPGDGTTPNDTNGTGAKATSNTTNENSDKGTATAPDTTQNETED